MKEKKRRSVLQSARADGDEKATGMNPVGACLERAVGALSPLLRFGSIEFLKIFAPEQ